jgi:hypothetical protein
MKAFEQEFERESSEWNRDIFDFCPAGIVNSQETFSSTKPLIPLPMGDDMCDVSRMIQRVIDPKYPNTRILWQAWRPSPVTRPGGPTPFVVSGSSTASSTTSGVTSSPSLTRSRGVTAAAGRQSYDPRYTPNTRTRNLELSLSIPTTREASDDDEAGGLDHAIQRVVSLRYPEARKTWRRSRQDPTYLKSRSFTYATQASDSSSDVIRSHLSKAPGN